MKRFIHTKSFVFDKARYVLSDCNGNKLVLSVNYESKKYILTKLKKNGAGFDELQKEAKDVARDLLKRKYKVNFVRKM